jgi:gamma-glutamyltranspeptidase/glutathione hydrolase
MPLADIVQPAIELARNGIPINPFQALISRIVSPILQATPAALAAHASPVDPDRLILQGETHRQPQLADLLDLLLHEGESLFYAGEIGQQLVKDSIEMGGHLRQEDLLNYRVVTRAPLRFTYRSSELISNPLPSLGGTLIAFALGLLQTQPLGTLTPGSEAHLRRLSRVMRLTQQGREADHSQMERLLSPDTHREYQAILNKHAISKRGTTQISIADAEGNLASMTLSNGEGCGYMVPGTGVMMNNMLGEEDLNPGGFHRWQEDERLSSMMSPSLLLTPSGDAIVTGSGGSNRIRSAVLQVISNLLDFSMSPAEAVSHPRIHFESDLLSLEPGIPIASADAIADEFPMQQRWQEKNLFFGGAHTVMRGRKGDFAGVGDERRGGVCIGV